MSEVDRIMATSTRTVPRLQLVRISSRSGNLRNNLDAPCSRERDELY